MLLLMSMSTSLSTPLGWSLNKASIDNPNKQFRTEGGFQFCRINILFALTKEQIKFFTPASDLAQSQVRLTLVLFYRASNEGSRRFHDHKKAPTRAFCGCLLVHSHLRH